MDSFEELEKMVSFLNDDIKKELEKFKNKKIKISGMRTRKKLKELTKMCGVIDKLILKETAGMKVKKRCKKKIKELMEDEITSV